MKYFWVWSLVDSLFILRSFKKIYLQKFKQYMEVFFIIIYLFIYKARVIIRVFDTFVTGYLFNS